MASYHLSVKTVKRSVGRSAVAAAAYRAGAQLACDREGRVHDYTRKQGIVGTFILAPDAAPGWVQDRAALWNAAEDRETRRNAVTAREWELGLPAELDDAGRFALALNFAQALVARYGVVADVAVHTPHREGDQRNHHVHILTTTREIGADGLGAKTRILDAAKIGGAEIEAMRAYWADLQNRALEQAGQGTRVDHRSLEDQREAALERGDDLAAMALDRDPELKLGPAANAMERKALRDAVEFGVDYVPVTERGRVNHARRQQRDLLADLRDRAERAHEAWSAARAADASRFSAAVEAARALFGASEASAFAKGFEKAWTAQDSARKAAEAEARDRARRALEEQQARDRQKQLDVERARFIKEAAQRWQATWHVVDAAQRETLQDRIVDQIAQKAERYDISFDELAAPINQRAKRINEERVEAERQKQQEHEQQKSRSRDAGYDFGM
ncbi:molybdopterin-guanine dinucleotide biosynthesis protein MobA [Paracoccus kondratievae]|uniref:MobQ family relaxase n=1 Tax=Paracoccus kondratievae TaxID=135740 RepID=UPI0012661A38|nr:MobQ family relaxase [Paracoccus kondratievae]QFQ89073.1 molybdopterin-guanine dinucleotide biosynthesis protein MobA [Paracoccus kondratievae]